MKQESRIESGLEQSWRKVGNNFRQTTSEVAFELAGEELVSQVVELSGNPEGFPNPAALAFLEMKFSGSAEEIITRAEQIQQERLKQ